MELSLTKPQLREKNDPRGKFWNFTLYESEHQKFDEIERKLRLFKSGHAWCNYICWGHEKCPTTNNNHLQGYIQLNTRTRFSVLKRALELPTINLSVLDGRSKAAHAERARNYTAKEGKQWEEHGSFEGTGHRPATEDINPLDVMHDMRSNMREDELIDKWGAYYISHKGSFRECIKDMRNDDAKEEHKDKYIGCKLRPWQEEAIDHLLTQDDREILFITDEAGNSGKSWLAGYLHTQWGAMYTNSTAYKDVMYAFNHQEYVVFDLSRDHAEHANYGIMEAMKNGRAFSGKYSSGERVFKPCKIVVFMNKSPDYSKLSIDRYKEKTPIMLGEERLIRQRRDVQIGITRKRQLEQEDDTQDIDDVIANAFKVAKIAPGQTKNTEDIWMQPQDKALHQQFDGQTENPPIFVLQEGAEWVGSQEALDMI